MKIVGVIPARYKSSRFPGKPLADICGKPMIWWVYHQVKKVKAFEDVLVAIDHPLIENCCKEFGIPYIMTQEHHPEHISRVWEVSEKVLADYYICVNGDEPLIEPNCIEKVIPHQIQTTPYFSGAMRILTDPAEVIDFSNIKLAVDRTGRCIYMSRTPIPYPRGSLLFQYKKYVGIECFNKAALDLFVTAPMGDLERVEDIDHLRFLEQGQNIYFTEVSSDSLSVDTLKDLEKVRMMMKERLSYNE